MLIAIEYSPNGLCLGYYHGGGYVEKQFPLSEADSKNNILFNEIVTANDDTEITRTAAFFEQCLKNTISPYEQSGNKIVFLRLQNCSEEAENAFERAAYSAGNKFGEVLFLDKIDTMAAYAIKSHILGRVNLLSFDYGITLCTAEIVKKNAQPEFRKIEEKTAPFRYTSAELTLKALSNVTGVTRLDYSKLEPSLSEITEIISSSTKKGDIEYWFSSQSEIIELLSFRYDGIGYKLSVKDIFDAYDNFSKDLGAFQSNASDGVCPVIFCGVGCVPPIVKYVISKKLNHGVTSNISVQSRENFALIGAIEVATGRTSFSYEFEYDIGIKAFTFDTTSEGDVVVKPIYVPLIGRGELSAQYSKRKIFDNIEIKVEDCNENLVLYRNDKLNRIIEMPVVLLSKLVKDGSALKVGFETVGRELYFFLFNNRNEQLMSLPLSSLFITSAPSITIKQ